MTRAPFIVIDGKPHRWKDILDLRRAQLAAAAAAEGSQLALFAALHDDRRPPAERTASGRYLQPSLFENKVTNKVEPSLSRLLTRTRASRPLSVGFMASRMPSPFKGKGSFSPTTNSTSMSTYPDRSINQS
jgi:hypothetical protein